MILPPSQAAPDTKPIVPHTREKRMRTLPSCQRGYHCCGLTVFSDAVAAREAPDFREVECEAILKHTGAHVRSALPRIGILLRRSTQLFAGKNGLQPKGGGRAGTRTPDLLRVKQAL